MLGWVVLAFTAARFAAMGFNRIVDREFDARNPRTQMRELPRGAMSVREAWLSVAVASAVFVAAAGMLNRLCLLLSPIALGWVFFYSFTKRFTRLAHLALGLGMSIAPVGGFLAVTGRWSNPWWLLCVLATTVVTWGAGFDVLYALPDIAFDRAHGVPIEPAHSAFEAMLAMVGRTIHHLPLVADGQWHQYLLNLTANSLPVYQNAMASIQINSANGTNVPPDSKAISTQGRMLLNVANRIASDIRIEENELRRAVVLRVLSTIKR
jgi:putative 4-hydroxybenzoate polyprenyltransferase